LFAKIGLSYGVGSDSTRFALPDLRGRFLRGADLSTGVDPNRSTRTALIFGTFTLTGSSITNGSSTVTVSSTANLAVGMSVSGTGIPASSVVLSIISETQFQLGNTTRSAVNATVTNASVTLTFSRSPIGDFVGSFQANATARPSTDFTGTGSAASGGSHSHKNGVADDITRAFVYGGTTDGMPGSATATMANNEDARTYQGFTSTDGSHTHSVSISFVGGGDNETRPSNLNANYIIKYWYMNAYSYDSEGFYVGETPRQPSPLEPGVWLTPGNSTLVAPPEIPEGFKAKLNFETNQWELVEIPAPIVETTPIEEW
jgi:microcystin-dependent protein